MAKSPCIECGARPKWGARHRCIVCALRGEPIGLQVEHSRRRLAMVPEELRVKRVPEKAWPTGRRWCAGCQTFVDLADVPKGVSRCRACASAATHSARLEKVYGIDSLQYDALLKLQGGKCAICRARPRSKRLAVDHDHKTNEVRGLLCSRCNHDLLGAGWDSIAVLSAAVAYLNAPPMAGAWIAPEMSGAVRPSPASNLMDGLVTASGRKVAEHPSSPQRMPIPSFDALPDDVPTLVALFHGVERALKRLDPAPF